VAFYKELARFIKGGSDFLPKENVVWKVFM
jgi:hypothetical protein